MRRIVSLLLSVALTGQTGLAGAAEVFVYRHPKPADPVGEVCDVTVKEILDNAAPKSFKEASKAVKQQSVTCTEVRRQAAEGTAPTALAPLGASVTGLAAGRLVQGDAIAAKVSPANASGAVSYAIASGALPAGVTLSGAGDLTGQFLAVGPFSASIQVTDAAGRQASAAFAGEVVALAPTVILPQPAATYFAGDVFQVAPRLDNGTAPFKWTVKGPAWLKVDPSSGALGGILPSGTPGFSFRVAVTDALGRTGDAGYADIGIVTPSATSTVPTSVVEGGTVAGRFSANLPGATWAKSSASAGAGEYEGSWLAVAADGSVTGTAPGVDNALTFSLGAEATLGTRKASVTAKVQVLPSTVSLKGFPSSALKGDAIVAQATTNLAGTVTWSLAQAPEWLTIDATGAITGKVAGSASGIVVRATRGLLVRESLPFSLAMVTPEVNVSGFPSAVRSGVTAKGSLSTTIAEGTWSVGSAPAGFELSASATGLTGIAPEVRETTDFALSVARATPSGVRASANLPVTVVPPLVISPVLGEIGSLVGDPVTFRPVVTGAQGGLTFALRKGPAGNESDAEADLDKCKGVTFSRLTGVIDGKPTTECRISDAFISVSDDGGSRPSTAAVARTTAFTFSAGGPALGTSVTDMTVLEGGYLRIPFETNVPNPTWSLSSGAPAWMRIGLDGVLAGTAPETDTDTDIQVEVIAQWKGREVRRSYVITVKGGQVVVSLGLGEPIFDGGPMRGIASTTIGFGASYSLSNNPSWLGIDKFTGAMTGTASVAYPATNVVVTATRGNVTANSAPFDIPLSMPAVTVSGAPFAVSGGRRLSLKAATNLPYPAWSLVDGPSWMSVGPDGSIFGVPSSVEVDTPVRAKVRATSRTLSADAAFEGTVTVAGSTMSVGPVRDATRYQDQDGSIPAPYVTGARGQVTWTVTEGQIPNGLKLEADGSMTGVAKLHGYWAIVLTATDEATGQQVSTNRFKVTVQSGTSSKQFTIPDIYAGLNEDVVVKIPAIGGAVGKITWDGSKLMAASGKIDAAGLNMVFPKIGAIGQSTPSTYSLNISGVDEAGQKWESNYFVFVRSNGREVLYYPYVEAYSGEPFSVEPIKSSGIGDVIYTVKESDGACGKLPKGLSLNATTGVVSGTVEINESDFGGQTVCFYVNAQKADASRYTYSLFQSIRIKSKIVDTGGEVHNLLDQNGSTAYVLKPSEALTLRLSKEFPLTSFRGEVSADQVGNSYVDLRGEYSLDGSVWYKLTGGYVTSWVGFDAYPEKFVKANFVRITNRSKVNLNIYDLEVR